MEEKVINKKSPLIVELFKIEITKISWKMQRETNSYDPVSACIVSLSGMVSSGLSM